MRPSDSRLIQFDWITFTLYISLLVIGWLMIYASSYKGDEWGNLFDFSTQYGKQFIWIGFSVLLFFLTQILDSRFWHTLAYPIFAFSIILLILVLFLGTEIKGSKSWFHLAGFSFQPAEFAKFATALALSAYLSYYKTEIKKRKHLILSCAIFLLPASLILLQPDAGSALVFSSFFILLYREGLSPFYYLVVFSAIALFILSLIYPTYYVVAGLLLLGSCLMVFQKNNNLLAYLMSAGLVLIVLNIIGFSNGWNLPIIILDLLVAIVAFFYSVKIKLLRTSIYTSILVGVAILFSLISDYGFNNILKPHQQERINVWLQPELCDPRGSLYNVLQSKTAIGSGGLLGKGFLKGTMTKFNFVPEQSTDFIFCTVGEEQGFIGVFGVLIIYIILLWRIVGIAERARAKFNRCYAYSIAGFLFFHLFISIGMTMGLVPIIGIPLPFISYGGSSLILFSLMIGVLLKLDSSRFSA